MRTIKTYSKMQLMKLSKFEVEQHTKNFDKRVEDYRELLKITLESKEEEEKDE